jgi:hypothetical protein
MVDVMAAGRLLSKLRPKVLGRKVLAVPGARQTEDIKAMFICISNFKERTPINFRANFLNL